MNSGNQPAAGAQIYLLGLTDEDGNCWEEVIRVNDMSGILCFLDDHRYDLMYAKGISEGEFNEWREASPQMQLPHQ